MPPDARKNTDANASAALLKRGDPDRYLATLAAPVALRPKLFVLYAFNLEVARAPWVTQEALIAEMRLQWWRDVVANAASGAARAHEVAGPLHDLIRDVPLPLDVLDRMIFARRWDVYREGFADTTALAAYLDDTAAGLMWLAARVAGAACGAEATVRAYGRAAGMAAFLRALPELTARGRKPLPDAAPQAVAALARLGLAWLDIARRGRADVPAHVRPALLAGWTALPILRQAAIAPERVLDGSLGLSEFSRRGRLLWQAATGRW